jgi:2-polyprenyl-6-methoxyphenol hydroxylase-like FAD-dependent oxidoreductase
MTFDVGPFALRGAVRDTNGGLGGFCPRRTVLDKILVDAAVENGVELREGYPVRALVWDDGRVVGIKGGGRGHDGGVDEERARVVIGADGVHSFVARAVRAPEYDVKPPLATFYYSYYSGFDADDIEQYVRDHHGAACFPTHDDLTVIVAVWPSRRFDEVRTDIEKHVHEVHRSTPSVADRLRRATREDDWHGTRGVPNGFRKPYGPGWALVGDAGYEKDPITAQGISDAFIDAEFLVDALDAGLSGQRPLEAALAEYQSRRDRRAKPMYDFTCDLARLEPPSPQMRELFGALCGNQDATDRFYSAITGSLPLPEFMAPDNIGRIVGSAGH